MAGVHGHAEVHQLPGVDVAGAAGCGRDPARCSGHVGQQLLGIPVICGRVVDADRHSRIAADTGHERQRFADQRRGRAIDRAAHAHIDGAEIDRAQPVNVGAVADHVQRHAAVDHAGMAGVHGHAEVHQLPGVDVAGAAGCGRDPARCSGHVGQQLLGIPVICGRVVDADRHSRIAADTGHERQRFADQRRSLAIDRARHGNGLRWQAGLTQTVDPCPVRGQVDRRRAGLDAVRRGGQANEQAAAVRIPRRQSGKRPAVGRDCPGCAADAAIQRLGSSAGGSQILDAQRLRHRRTQVHVAEVHRVWRRETGRSVDRRNRVRDGQGYRRQRRRVTGCVLVHRRERDRLGIDPGHRGVYRHMQALVAVAGRDHW